MLRLFIEDNFLVKLLRILHFSGCVREIRERDEEKRKCINIVSTLISSYVQHHTF